jgi:predicted acyltransferase
MTAHDATVVEGSRTLRPTEHGRGLSVGASCWSTTRRLGHVYRQLEHAPWHGCTTTDLIFPFFLFIVGVSITLGLVPRLERGADPAQLRRTALVRAAKIVGLGLLLHALAFWWLDQDRFRPWGVLQRIGLCYLLAAFVALYVRPPKQCLLIGTLLLGYCLLLAAGGSYEPFENIASRVDTRLLGRMNYQFDAVTGRGHDPEGLLSTLGALATTLLGIRAGDWLRRGQSRLLLQAGMAAVLLGAVWAFWLPLNKNLWTSSYVLWTAGWAAFALWCAHRLVDLLGKPSVAAASASMVRLRARLSWSMRSPVSAGRADLPVASRVG